jgi:hypothetical protein
MAPTLSGNVPDQNSEFGSYFVQKHAQSVNRAAVTKGLDESLEPATAFAVVLSVAEHAKNALRAASSKVVLARREFFTSHPRVEPECLPLRCEPRFFGFIERVEPADHPALTLYHGQTHDDREREFCFSPGLLESFSPLRLIVLISDQQNPGQVGGSNS